MYPPHINWACREEFDGQLDFDLGLLMACHPSDPDPEVAAGSEAALKRLSTRATQSLIKQIFSLQSHATEGGRAVTLPPPVLALPRAKPVPQPKPLTKWQQFAKEKGIVKKKRSKLEFDEVSQDWKRRHGYKRANDEAAVPIIEASADDKVCTAAHSHYRSTSCARLWSTNFGIALLMHKSNKARMAYQFPAHAHGRRSNGVHPTATHLSHMTFAPYIAYVTLSTQAQQPNCHDAHTLQMQLQVQCA